MKRILLLFATTASALLVATSLAFGQDGSPEPDQELISPGVATSADGVRYVPGELVVADGDTVEVREIDARRLGAIKAEARDLETNLRSGRTKIPDVSGGNVQVSPNLVYQSLAEPNDPRYDEQYHLRQIKMPDAWNNEKGVGARVCVVDTGWDIGHNDLGAKVVEQRDVLNGDARASDGTGHGTGVAGLAAAETNNRNAVSGVGWGTNLAIAKAGDADGDFTVAAIKAGINWCGNVGGVSVINMSFGGPGFNDVINQEIQEQNANGRTLVAAAGNGGAGASPYYPAAYANVIGVGGSNPDGSLWISSAQGPEVDIVAPSGGIISTARNNDSRVFPQGTSLASPQVAGVAALLRARGLTRAETENRLLGSATDRGPQGNDTAWGRGFLNANCAVSPGEAGC